LVEESSEDDGGEDVLAEDLGPFGELLLVMIMEPRS
jgi:hypothetical protein